MKIILDGELADLFGDIDCLSQMHILTPSEAVRAIAANRPDFIRYLNDSGDRGVDFCVRTFEGDTGRTEAQLNQPAETFVQFTPLVRGEGGKGLMGAVLGVGLIAAAFLVPGGIGIFGMSISSTTLGLLGAGLLLNGLSMAMAPKDQKEKERDKSNILDRSPNVTNQGRPVPMGYGTWTITNPIVISAGITSTIVSGGGIVSSSAPLTGNTGIPTSPTSVPAGATTSAGTTTVGGRTAALTNQVLPARFIALDNYTPVYHRYEGLGTASSGAQNFAQTQWLQTGENTYGMRVLGTFGRLAVKLDFIEAAAASPDQASILTALHILSGIVNRSGFIIEEDRATTVQIYKDGVVTPANLLSTHTLKSGYNTINVASIAAYQAPYFSFALVFTGNGQSGFISVGEINVNGFPNTNNILAALGQYI